MIDSLDIWVAGTPRPQGSKRYLGNGRVIEASPHIRVWRATITGSAAAAAEAQGWATATGPVEVHLTFSLTRPRSHYRTGRHSDLLRADPPSHPAMRPDIDKLARACLDGLTVAQIMQDDSQVVGLVARKVWGCEAGVAIMVCKLPAT
jgi:Holliday junction resolvase RusA-like endonuclease